MKPTDSTRICDKCKIKVAKHICIACEGDICLDCVNILTFELQTKKFNSDAVKYYSAGQQGYNQKVLAKMNYALCKKCDSAIGKKDTSEIIQNSEEMKSLLNKIKKTILASRMASTLEDSEVESDNPLPELQNVDLWKWVYKQPEKGKFFSWFGKKKKKKDNNPFL